MAVAVNMIFRYITFIYLQLIQACYKKQQQQLKTCHRDNVALAIMALAISSSSSRRIGSLV